jgi:hypothetical protein
MIAQALLRGDTRNIPAIIITGMAIKKPIMGSTVIPVIMNNKPTNMRIKPTVTFDTRSNRQSFLFILSPFL